MLTPQLTNINRLLKGKTYEIALRLRAVLEAHDFSIPHLAKAHHWLLKRAGVRCSSRMDTQHWVSGQNRAAATCTQTVRGNW